MKFINLTRSIEIGANSYFLDFGDDGHLVLDAGLHPKIEGELATPHFQSLEDYPVDCLIISHAHHDHTGALPLFLRKYPNLKVFLSEPTYHLTLPLLHNSVEVMLKQRLALQIPEYPLYTHKEIDHGTERWQICHINKEWSLNGYPNPKHEPLTFRFYPSGHILGAVGVRIFHRGRRIFYTGDVSFKEQTLMLPADFPQDGIDVLIIESTRGAQEMEKGITRQTEIQRLIDRIENTFDRGGSVLIPIFALGKTQEIITTLFFEQQKGRLRKCPIYIGGLSRSFSEIYDRLSSRSLRRYPGFKILDTIAPIVVNGKKTHKIQPVKGELYLVTSGMMNENTISNILAQKFLPNEKNSIFFVGYCDPESPAGQLLATPRGNLVVLNSSSKPQPVLCEVDHFDLTSHAQREDILSYIQLLEPRTCILVHGDPTALEWFKQKIEEESPHINLVIPPPGQLINV
ncbi:MBL fold metallo-hydrolase [Methylacidiphilum caldifontis]|uniref:Exonuclease n=1 Tax=Methylacidiphilum caldifontis TaxID=2795386 RepID=A0A4Y8PJM4_9BACT|nr:MBL fold metallo-hydrolase [Methylacidiphilum caldifontis]QSR88233.1 MBL fold metallo-hydrolase [Methylacidiphilum caldifontis]TFE72511.1 exonuclease [Methylacidiphilum caldifontis]